MNKDSNLLQKANCTASVNSIGNQKKIDVLMAKIPENTDIIDDDTLMQRTIQIVTTSVIVNKRITTPVTLQIRPNKGSFNVNVALATENVSPR